MSNVFDDELGVGEEEGGGKPPDAKQEQAKRDLAEFFDGHREEVFFTRQVEILNESRYFHWVTSRAIKELKDEGVVVGEERPLSWGGHITLLWHRRHRYPRRQQAALVKLVEEYSDPNIGAALGLHGEMMVLEGFARNRFVMMGRKVREFEGRKWTKTGHDLDFVFGRDGAKYGMEVKNTLGYMEYKELQAKVEMAGDLGLTPVFVVGMVPKSWIHEVNGAGGFVLVMKYQLYPWTHRELAERVRSRFGLPVDAPRQLAEGTMARFVRWHEGRL